MVSALVGSRQRLCIVIDVVVLLYRIDFQPTGKVVIEVQASCVHFRQILRATYENVTFTFATSRTSRSGLESIICHRYDAVCLLRIV